MDIIDPAIVVTKYDLLLLKRCLGYASAAINAQNIANGHGWTPPKLLTSLLGKHTISLPSFILQYPIKYHTN